MVYFPRHLGFAVAIKTGPRIEAVAQVLHFRAVIVLRFFRFVLVTRGAVKQRAIGLAGMALAAYQAVQHQRAWVVQEMNIGRLHGEESVFQASLAIGMTEQTSFARPFIVWKVLVGRGQHLFGMGVTAQTGELCVPWRLVAADTLYDIGRKTIVGIVVDGGTKFMRASRTDGIKRLVIDFARYLGVAVTSKTAAGGMVVTWNRAVFMQFEHAFCAVHVSWPGAVVLLRMATDAGELAAVLRGCMTARARYLLMGLALGDGKLRVLHGAGVLALVVTFQTFMGFPFVTQLGHGLAMALQHRLAEALQPMND